MSSLYYNIDLNKIRQLKIHFFTFVIEYVSFPFGDKLKYDYIYCQYIINDYINYMKCLRFCCKNMMVIFVHYSGFHLLH